MPLYRSKSNGFSVVVFLAPTRSRTDFWNSSAIASFDFTGAGRSESGEAGAACAALLTPALAVGSSISSTYWYEKVCPVAHSTHTKSLSAQRQVFLLQVAPPLA